MDIEKLLEKATKAMLVYGMILVDGLGAYTIFSLFFENLLLALLLAPVMSLGLLIINYLIWEEMIKTI